MNRTLPPVPPESDILLNPDKTELAIKSIRSIRGCILTVAEAISRGTALSSTLAFNTMFIAEHDLADLCSVMGIETDGRARVEHRNQELRDAYARIAELEQQVGATVTPEAAQLHLANLKAQLNAWWKLEGFGFVSKLEFDGHGCSVSLSCMMSGRRFSSKTPVTDKQKDELWTDSLRNAGYVLEQEGTQFQVVDCEATRKVLTDLLRKRLPSATVTQFNNRGNFRTNNIILHNVDIYLTDISDLATLPTESANVDCSEM